MKANKICGILNLSENKEGLQPLTKNRPLAAMPFACRYRLIDFPLSNMTNAGINTIAMFLNENNRSLFDHIRSGKEWDLNTMYGGLFVFDERNADDFSQENYDNSLNFLTKSATEYVVIMGSKMICNIDLKGVLQHHKQQEADITVVYKKLTAPIEAGDHENLITLDVTPEGKILAHEEVGKSERVAESSALSLEIYLLKQELLLKLLANYRETGRDFSLDAVMKQAVEHTNANGFEYTGYLRQIYSVNSYFEGNFDMLEDRHLSALFQENQKIHTKAKNEVPTFYAEHSDVKDCLVANGCLLRGSAEHSLIFRNVVLEEGAKVKNSMIMQGAQVGAGARLEYVIADKKSVIAPGVELIGTRENPIVVKKDEQIETSRGAEVG
ncbi:glucose-1-phosphate adenylyltransferase subunit GlgD [Listeria newyorkensis]|uniref:Glucose-1-phosphate adenylyltransferase subunit GlgD n=1 Tax=Listeria newyorkensis TaxID=1497681 RepID=A0A841YW40_9LIST|nr:glucose-1-phosphate adenylyltransferase subunit GlgD [Listeria newyorkensis]MBC1457610.1 glucose-1-phosphate adenylyltransferase subunit GlgD [Listeria newyorkensis]